MNSHMNARTTPYARATMVARHRAGVPVREIAASFGVSPRTVSKWLARFRSQGEAGLANRSSRPHRTPQTPEPDRHAGPSPGRALAGAPWVWRRLAQLFGAA